MPPAKTLMGTFGMPGPDILRALGIPEEAHARISQAWHVFKQANAHRIHLFPGVEDMLRALRARGALLGVVTSKRPESYGRDFTPFGLDGYFDARVTCVDTVLHKPHPEPLRKLLKRLEVAPGEALYVGDSVYDRDCAIAAGVDFALAHLGQRPAGDGERHLAAPRAGRPAGHLGYIKKRGESAWLFPRSLFWRYFSVVCASGAFCALFWWWV